MSEVRITASEKDKDNFRTLFEDLDAWDVDMELTLRKIKENLQKNAFMDALYEATDLNTADYDAICRIFLENFGVHLMLASSDKVSPWFMGDVALPLAHVAIEIPNNITKIGGQAFSNNQICAVFIPKIVKDISSSAFLKIGTQVWFEADKLGDINIINPQAHPNYLNSASDINMRRCHFGKTRAEFIKEYEGVLLA